jgi:hypothetical protein
LAFSGLRVEDEVVLSGRIAIVVRAGLVLRTIGLNGVKNASRNSTSNASASTKATTRRRSGVCR